ncbi:MAG TPA: hypothetical protein VM431_12125 [Phycisphaerae bacterium]|nr:hypothetical protein [Phycisphaerae bacterium]
MPNAARLNSHDLDVLRRMAGRKAAIAADPVNLQRKAAWYAHDAGTGGRPMVLAEEGGVRDDVRPLPDSALECEDAWARAVEASLRADIYRFDVLKDDHVVEPRMTTGWQVNLGDYGVQAVVQSGDRDGKMGARRWDPPIKDIDRDFGRLHPRRLSVDREATLAETARLEAVCAGILPVEIRGGLWWTLGMTWPAIDLVGLDGLMLLMYDNPAGLHRLMAFLRDDHRAVIEWSEREGLLTLNNENDYIGSGSMGYTGDLPPNDHKPGDTVRRKDLWALSESQETVGVGPRQFEEFIFPYQLSLVEGFGKSYYGCCEPVHTRWEILKRIPNLARVSVSPWADEEVMAAACGTRIVYSRKPNPTLISTERFDEAAIRADLRRTLTVARGCRIELIMKDVHTLNNQPEHLPRWVQLAREVIDEMA